MWLLTCRTKVVIQMATKSRFRCRPSRTFLWPWIFLALSSLKRVIRTKVLKITVKCSVGRFWPWADRPRPLSTSNKSSPKNKKGIWARTKQEIWRWGVARMQMVIVRTSREKEAERGIAIILSLLLRQLLSKSNFPPRTLLLQHEELTRKN